jgi:sulfur-carrier protein
MSVTIRIPTQLRELSGGAAEVTAEGATVVDVLKDLEAKHAGFHERLFDDQGELRRFVNVFVADEDIRFLDGVNTDVADGATVSIIPAVAGGI